MFPYLSKPRLTSGFIPLKKGTKNRRLNGIRIREVNVNIPSHGLILHKELLRISFSLMLYLSDGISSLRNILRSLFNIKPLYNALSKDLLVKIFIISLIRCTPVKKKLFHTN